MTSIVICEKPSQARNLSIALGTSHGQILPARGHLLRLEEPEEVDPRWKQWTLDTLVPSKGLYGYVEDGSNGKAPYIEAIKRALKTANEVIIATDCDREGEGIGRSLLEHFGFKGKVRRAIFTSEDQITLKKSFSSLEPISNWEKTYQSFIARQQSDQIYNLTLTRVATKVLREPYTKGVIGIGRVKTATLGIICRREKEILNFKPVQYFEIRLTVAGATETVILRYGPTDDKRILERKVAEEIAEVARGYRGPVSVKTERKSASPPRPPDLATLQQRAIALWGWTATKASEIAQELYSEIKAITYPRGDVRYLPEVMIPDVPNLQKQIQAISPYSSLHLKDPIIRKGKDGVFSDKQLNGIAHYAIIPNINCPGGLLSATLRMSKDQLLLFDLVARSFLACIGEDYIYDSTTISVPISVPNVDPSQALRFTTSGSVPVYAGWRAIDDSAPEDAVALPPLRDGEAVVAQKAEVKATMTKPPPRFSEAGVLKQMKEAWRYCKDPAEQERLQEAKGIGTPATRDGVIAGLKKQNLVVLDQRNLVPTTAGMLIYDVLLDCAPSLVDPASTARMEAMLDEILVGKTDARTVIGLITKQADIMSRAIQRSPVKINLETATSTRKAAAAATKGGTAPGAKPARAAAAGKGGATKARSATATSKPTAGAVRPAPGRAGGNPAPAPGPATATAERIWLTVPTDPEEQRKAYGMKARYDALSKKWWVAQGTDLAPFRQLGWI